MSPDVPLTLELKRTSICKCGYPLVEDYVDIGTQYYVVPSSQGPGFLICGGCGLKQSITMILVRRRGVNGAGYVPLEMFLE